MAETAAREDRAARRAKRGARTTMVENERMDGAKVGSKESDIKRR